jgi:hypothetical protein
MTAQVTDTKPSVHAAAVVQIFRYRRNILTLDESGKLHVSTIALVTYGRS